MSRVQTFAALALFAAGIAGSAQASTLTYEYSLHPGLLTFAVDSTQLNSAGFGTVSPAQGLLSLNLDINGLSFTATEDAQYPTFPVVTLQKKVNVLFASFTPLTRQGQFDFEAIRFGGPTGTFDWTFTTPDGTVLEGTAGLPEPFSLSILGLGLAGLAIARRRLA